MKNLLLTGIAAGTLMISPAFAQGHHNHANHIHDGPEAPISVMGDHLHDKGEWMLSYRYSRMNMDGNRNGTNDLSPEDVITFTNPNAPPANLRVVPTQMTMDMHMLGVMYGVTDWLTLMGMAMYTQKEMDHITFQGMAGTNRLGTFTTRSSGWGDTSLTGLIRLHEGDTHHIHLHAGLSAPTGSIKEEDDVLTPANARPTLRLPYAMQLGSGTWDALSGLTYTGHKGDWGWGAQYKGTIRLEDENDQGYSWGDRHTLTAWGAKTVNPWLEGNLRLTAETMDHISGSDSNITAPVQTADPDNYGGEIVEISAGLNITPPQWNNHTLGVEITTPIYQDLNGPQMERDWALTAGWKVTF